MAEEELPERSAEAFARVAPGARGFAPHELSGDAKLHIPGRDPEYGVGVDSRRRVAP